MSNNTIVYCCIGLVVGALTISVFGIPYLFDYNNKKFWEERSKESIEYNIKQNSNFQTLTDCKEMILQLTEMRFWNDTFKDQAWNHYRGLC